MAALSITAANVQPGTGAITRDGYALEAITAGQAVYRNSTTGLYGLADANGASADIRTPVGIALNTAGINQPLKVQTAGLITIGGTAVVGTVYVVGSTAGAINPTTDLTTGWYTSVVGIGYSATQLMVGVVVSGVAVP
jgi:hypothetical protein